MGEYDLGSATTPSTVTDYSIASMSPDSPVLQDTFWDNNDFNKWFGNYKQVAKIKKSIDAFATWVLGKGFTADNTTQLILENLDGWGEDTFQSIMWNMIVMKKVNGDAYAEIIRSKETGDLINIKPLNPGYMRIILDKRGRIKGYERRQPDKKKPAQIFKPGDILHLSNDRVADEIHGTSVIEAVEWIVEAQEEAMRDNRRVLHRNGVARIIEVDTDNKAKIADMKAQWKDAIEKGDVMILPKGSAQIINSNVNIEDPIPWLNYLDNYFYIAIGIPKSILGGIESTTEAGGKISYLTFEQIYTREITELEADLWNQLAVRIKYNSAVSLKDDVQESEEKNTSQTGFQPQDAGISGGRE